MSGVPQGPELRIGIEAGADLSGEQFQFVKVSGGKLAKVTGATDKPIGVLQENDVTSGRIGEVVVFGPTYVVAADVIAQDALIGTGADGRADTKIPGTDTTEYVCGRALEAAGAAGQQIQAVVNCITPHRAA